ncbi:MAG: glycosyltransferase [Chloroflexi bacterium]|nr:MAG: glycosyltransferase [Chloroflexota bacterium]
MNFLKASIVIPTYNGADTLDECLHQIYAQETPWDFDVHIIDSGSTDGTLEIIGKYPVNLTQIPNSEFSHGGTRNRAAQGATGEFILFLVQDAVPIGTDWLRTLVAAADQDGIVGAFGSQLPRPDASIYTKWVMTDALPDSQQMVIKRVEEGESWELIAPRKRYDLAFFHDANSCLRREVFLQYPYRPVQYGEDMDWSRRVLMAGYAVGYEPKACVMHSHDRSVVYEFKRAYADHSLARELFDLNMIKTPYALVRTMVWYGINSFKKAMKTSDSLLEKFNTVIQTSSRYEAQMLGAYVGARSAEWEQRFPTIMKRLDKSLRNGV